MTFPERHRSNLWFLMPIFLGFIGGVIAYFILRKDDRKKAKNCLYVGIAMMIAGLVFNALIASLVPELGPGFRVNL
jgi:uncharacterized membrane protein